MSKLLARKILCASKPAINTMQELHTFLDNYRGLITLLCEDSLTSIGTYSHYSFEAITSGVGEIIDNTFSLRYRETNPQRGSAQCNWMICGKEFQCPQKYMFIYKYGSTYNKLVILDI